MKFNVKKIESSMQMLGYDLFSLPVINELNKFDYHNTNGTCLAFAFAYCVNDFKGFNLIKPLKDYKVSIYDSLNKLVHQNAIFTRKEKTPTTLKTLIDNKFTGLISVSCNGGYHAMFIKNGLIYNNWNNDYKGLTLNELKSEFGYKKTPKLRWYSSSFTIISLYNILKDTNVLCDYFD